MKELYLSDDYKIGGDESTSYLASNSIDGERIFPASDEEQFVLT
ncbi:hypothetical protein [Vibrio inusitatus]|nr:hypothetical protein [Vibrio inusitatus]